MTDKDKVAYQNAFRQMADNLGLRVREDYSGRGMFGKTCLAVVTCDFVYDTDIQQEFAQQCVNQGVPGKLLSMDNMGLEYVLYLR